MENLQRIKKRVIKSIDFNIDITNNFTELEKLKQCKKDLKNANSNKTIYILGYLKAQTDVFNGYLDDIDYSNFNYWLFKK